MTIYTGEHGEIMAFFVGGPANGMTRFLPRDRMEVRHIPPNIIDLLTEAQKEMVSVRFSDIRYHLYLRTHRMQNPYYENCYIFEWMGERG